MSLPKPVARRDVLRWMATGAAAISLPPARAQQPGERPPPSRGAQVVLPRLRVPVALIIDDSTCLVNLNRFAIPQFQDAWRQPERYNHDWRSMPHEIPDSFVRKFGQWCAQHGVKGKYSVVPYPACMGRLDREVPGWTRREMDESISLVRELLMPHWDIHPELVTHTWAIDVRTGHPYPERSIEFMENWNWSVGKSTDELAQYFRYALDILKNVDLPCTGITTPGGFGSRVRPQLAQATLESCRDVFNVEIPHYFRDLFDRGENSVAPRVEYASGLDGDQPRCVVSIIGCTGDWTGGWDCSDRGDVDRFITADLGQGRMVEVIERGEPAVMVCHWTGIYFNGEEVGLQVFQEVVRRLHARYDHLLWMKLSELARYWAAKELTSLAAQPGRVDLHAPYACPAFTVRIEGAAQAAPRCIAGDRVQQLRQTSNPRSLDAGTWYGDAESFVACFDLPRGSSSLVFA